MAGRLLRLLQLTDSSFPTGGYAFSHGLEGLFALGYLQGEREVAEFARVHIEETLARQEVPAVRLAFGRAQHGDLNGFAEIDRMLAVLMPVTVFREASVRLGRSLLGTATPLFAMPFAERVSGAIREGVVAGHHPAVFGVVMAEAGVDLYAAQAAYGASSLNSYVAAAVRLGVVGQNVAQQIIASLEPALERAIGDAQELRLDQLGGYTPLIDLAGMRQPDLPARLFAS